MGPNVDAVGFIGAGRASRILFSRLRELQTVRQLLVYVSTRSKETRSAVKKDFPSFLGADVLTVFQQCNPIFLAVPSTALVSVLEPVKKQPALLAGKVIFCVCVRVSQQTLNEALPGAHVIRILHNLPCQVGKGLITAFRHDRISGETFQRACKHLRIYGDVIVVDNERLLLESIPLLCFPAMLLKAFGELDANISRACPELPEVREMFRKTVIGVGAWLEMLNEDYEAGVNLVATPGGFTEKSVRHVEGNIKGLIDAFLLELEAVHELRRSCK